MKRAAFVIVTFVVLSLARPAAARPHDPESFEQTAQRSCAVNTDTSSSELTAWQQIQLTWLSL